MSSAGPILAVLGIAAALFLLWYVEKKRREMWEALAGFYGFRYFRQDPYDIPKIYGHFALFRQGHSRKASHCLEGVYGDTSVLLFDYRYTTGSGKQRQTHHLSALLAGTPRSCPYMLIRPESFFDKVGDFLGFEDIDFELEEFNRRFHVKSEDKRFAYDICHGRMMEFLLAHEKLTWEICGNKLLLYGLGTFDREEVKDCLHSAVEFLKLTPKYLLAERQS